MYLFIYFCWSIFLIQLPLASEAKFILGLDSACMNYSNGTYSWPSVPFLPFSPLQQRHIFI